MGSQQLQSHAPQAEQAFEAALDVFRALDGDTPIEHRAMAVPVYQALSEVRTGGLTLRTIDEFANEYCL